MPRGSVVRSYLDDTWRVRSLSSVGRTRGPTRVLELATKPGAVTPFDYVGEPAMVLNPVPRRANENGGSFGRDFAENVEPAAA